MGRRREREPEASSLLKAKSPILYYFRFTNRITLKSSLISFTGRLAGMVVVLLFRNRNRKMRAVLLKLECAEDYLILFSSETVWSVGPGPGPGVCMSHGAVGAVSAARVRSTLGALLSESAVSGKKDGGPCRKMQKALAWPTAESKCSESQLIVTGSLKSSSCCLRNCSSEFLFDFQGLEMFSWILLKRQLDKPFVWG